MFFCNKNKILMFVLLISLSFFIKINVFALEDITVADGDYELICVYSDGAKVTIARDEIYLTKDVSGTQSSSASNITFFLFEDQQNEKDADGKITTNNVGNVLTESRRCPVKLWIYEVSSASDENVEEELRVDDVMNYYYATRKNKESEIAGTHAGGFLWLSQVPNASMLDDPVYLKSEEVNLTTTKETTICDYQSQSDDYLGVQSMSYYLFNNITLVESSSRIAPIYSILTECPYQNKTLYLNDPGPQSIGGAYSSAYKYNYVRFSYSQNANTCKNDKNDGKECVGYEFIGSRNGTVGDDGELDPCEMLGNDTVNIMKKVIIALQIIVPALVIVLICIDIAKMVLAGNLDEELPKKKKSIIIRLVLMISFFFAPVIASLVIKLLVEAGIDIGDIACLIN